MTEPTIEISHVGIMGRREGFVGLDGNLLIVRVAGEALLLLGRLGRLGYPMTVSASHSAELMAVAQRYLSPQTCCSFLMTSITGGASHAFRIYVSRRKHFFAPVTHPTISGCYSLHLLRLSPDPGAKGCQDGDCYCNERRNSNCAAIFFENLAHAISSFRTRRQKKGGTQMHLPSNLYRRQGFSAAAFLPTALPKTTQSVVPFPPSLFVPCTPPVTSPAA